MCGIWFLCTHKCFDKGILYNSFNKIKHRGPDRSRFLEFDDNPTVFIGFHRLAIMDTTTDGDQPHIIHFKNRSIYSICNGEIYNFKKLITKYKLQPKSHADTEILPLLYEKLTFPEMLNELDGEYAIVIVDVDHSTNTTKICAARDRFGVRPLFYSISNDTIAFCSELKGLSDFVTVNGQFPAGSYMETTFSDSMDVNNLGIQKYYTHVRTDLYDTAFPFEKNLSKAQKLIRDSFTDAVKLMMHSDRPMGALLSGGLDSSLVVAIASRALKEEGKGRRLRTFSIGMPNSTDKYYAELVAKHCDTDHTHIELSNQDFLDTIKDIVYITETYDVTTVRASTGQYLISRWIAKHTDIKVVLIGDGSDELTAGYKYFHKAPDSISLHKENERLLSDIHFFDVLRADRGIASNGLEARVPFLHHNFVDTYLSVQPELRIPKDGMEKWLLRSSFEGYLPKEVLYRSKEAFSDGVSSKEKSWFQIIQEDLEEKISDQSFKEFIVLSQVNHPVSKEGMYYKGLFWKYFGKLGKHDHVIPYYWLPKWCGNVTEPSARVLDVYST